MIAVLASRTYRGLFAAQVLSLVGTGLTTVALALFAFDLAGDDAGVVLGTALAIKMLAYVGIAPIAGALSSRFPRRSFLIGLDIGRAALVGLLPFVDQIWQVYALIFAFQSLSAAFTPTFQATIPDVLPDERDYARALSLSRLAYDLENLLSPAIAGALLAVVSFHWLFVGNAIGFLASAALVASVVLPAIRSRSAEKSFATRLTRGIRIYLATPRLRGLLALSGAASAAGAMVIVNTVVYVRADLDGGERAVAMFLGVAGAGSMLTALALPRLLEHGSVRNWMLAGATASTLALAAGAFGPTYVAGLLIWFALGSALALINTPSGLLLRRSAQADDRPALFAANFALSHACWLVAYPVAGFASANFGVSGAFIVTAALCATSSVAAWLLWPRRDPEILPHAHDDLPEDHPHLGGRRSEHAHPFIIDDLHPVWPRSDATKER